MRKCCLWIAVIGLLLVMLLGILVAISIGNDPEASPEGGLETVPQLTAEELLSERKANATRFDATRKGAWVTVSGHIERIDGGSVYLRGDDFLSGVILEDLPTDVQLPLNAGDAFTATCRVGDYLLGSVFLHSCR